jgi:hypothetical protein
MAAPPVPSPVRPDAQAAHEKMIKEFYAKRHGEATDSAAVKLEYAKSRARARAVLNQQRSRTSARKEAPRETEEWRRKDAARKAAMEAEEVAAMTPEQRADHERKKAMEWAEQKEKRTRMHPGRGTEKDPFVMNQRAERNAWLADRSMVLRHVQPVAFTRPDGGTETRERLTVTYAAEGKDGKPEMREQQVWFRFSDATREYVRDFKSGLSKDPRFHPLAVPLARYCFFGGCLKELTVEERKNGKFYGPEVVSCPCSEGAWCNSVCYYMDSDNHAHTCKRSNSELYAEKKAGEAKQREAHANRLRVDQEQYELGYARTPNGEWMQLPSNGCTCGNCRPRFSLAPMNALWDAEENSRKSAMLAQIEKQLAVQRENQRKATLLEETRKEQEKERAIKAAEDLQAKMAKAREEKKKIDAEDAALKNLTVEQRNALIDSLIDDIAAEEKKAVEVHEAKDGNGKDEDRPSESDITAMAATWHRTAKFWNRKKEEDGPAEDKKDETKEDAT